MFHAIASPLSRTAAAQRLLCGWVLIAGWINVGCSPIQPQLRSPHDGQASAQAVDSGTDSRSREAQGEDEPLIVRGQNGGYSLPPDLQTPADGGRHQRGPLPVRGQPDATVAQGVELLPPRSGEDSEAGSADLQAAAGEGAVPGYSAAQPPTPLPFSTTTRCRHRRMRCRRARNLRLQGCPFSSRCHSNTTRGFLGLRSLLWCHRLTARFSTTPHSVGQPSVHPQARARMWRT